MAKTRLPYAPEFRRQMVELVHAGRTPEELAAEFEPTAQSIRNWVAQSSRNAGRGDSGLTEVDPISWTPDRLGPGSARWPRQDCPTHQSSAARWWNWCMLAVRRRNWLRSLNRRRNRSGTGLLSLREMRAGATAA